MKSTLSNIPRAGTKVNAPTRAQRPVNGPWRVIMGARARPLASPAAPRPAPRVPSAVCRAAVLEREIVNSTKYDAGSVTVTSTRLPSGDYEVEVITDAPRPMMLHWAVDEWKLPDVALAPPGTKQVDDKAVQTPFEGGRVVRLVFPKDKCPERVVFVLKETQPEAWINNGNFFVCQIRPPSVDDVMSGVIKAESEFGNWSLLNRFNLANEVLDGAEAAGAEGMAFVFTWMRLSQNKLLDWARKANYQSKDIAWTQKVISSRFAEKAIGAKDPWVRLYARMSLAGLPRGGGNGDDIRMGILNIMRAHGIKEGHRPGLDEPFIEQWHQKLHQNTTAEDVTICEAYLAFLHSGNHDDYWRVLWDNGRITKERLESMHNPIRAWPMHLPHLIPAFNHYLWILKTCHAGADMDTAAEMAKGSLDDGTRWNVFDLLKNRNEWWAAGKIVEIREQMKYSWANSRDVLLLDIALDSYFKTCIERGDWDAAGRDGVMGGIELVLRNAAISAESEELRLCYGLWQRLMAAPDRWSKGWSEVAMAVCQRVSLALAHYGDEIVTHVQPHARLFGERCKIDPAYILNFSEEVIRSQSTFTLSMLLGKLEPQVRASAGAASWQIVSQQGSVFGRVLQTASLEDIQGKTFAEPTVVIAGHMGGMEDIPENVTAVLTQSATDILSHVAIRARSQGVLLATCFDAGLWGALASGHPSASFMTVDVTPSGDVLPATLEAGAAQARIASASSASSSSSLPPLTLPAPRPTDRFVLSDTEFGEGVVGAKARNLAVLRGKGLPDSIKLPRSIALPFGTFEKVLAHGVNTGLQGTFHALVGELENEKKNGRQGIPAALGRLRSLVASSLVAPPEVLGQISASAASVGLNIEASNFAAVWKAICGVWASKWNDRAYLSRKARAVPESALVMSVLVQQVVPAQYAFVLHTADPLTGAPGATHGEVVLGMGESLVGNAPGRAFGFSAPSAGASGDSVQIASLPSKRAALWCPAEGTMIARSDTNGEDLEAFSGAGLYDSIPVEALIDAPVNYTDEGLLWDAGYSKALAARLVSVGSAVEKAFGSSQDIEGVVDASGAITVVQSRPIQIHKS